AAPLTHWLEFPSPLPDGSSTPSATPARTASVLRHTALHRPTRPHARLLPLLPAKPGLPTTEAAAPQSSGDPAAIALPAAEVCDHNPPTSDAVVQTDRPAMSSPARALRWLPAPTPTET